MYVVLSVVSTPREVCAPYGGQERRTSVKEPVAGHFPSKTSRFSPYAFFAVFHRVITTLHRSRENEQCTTDLQPVLDNIRTTPPYKTTQYPSTHSCYSRRYTPGRNSHGMRVQLQRDCCTISAIISQVPAREKNFSE